MENLTSDEPIRINLLSLNCHFQVGSQETDQIYLKYNGKRIYPSKGAKFKRFSKGEGIKLENVSLQFSSKNEVDTVVIELWYRKNLIQNALAGRFFLMLNISEIGFSATQLIRSSTQEKSHYLLHWEMRKAKESKRIATETVQINKSTD
ncbi:MAG TPA: hypothetical protein DCX54_01405 [Flavobacteriales bacterium]|nr:hypothetical protein [Flavobacteriales bacterium]